MLTSENVNENFNAEYYVLACQDIKIVMTDILTNEANLNKATCSEVASHQGLAVTSTSGP
jgi:hypothetical protein